MDKTFKWTLLGTISVVLALFTVFTWSELLLYVTLFFCSLCLNEYGEWLIQKEREKKQNEQKGEVE